MNHQRNLLKPLANLSLGGSRHWAVWLAIANLAIILGVTLFPYRFLVRDSLEMNRQLYIALHPTGDLWDLVANILLFPGLGFGVAGILKRRSLVIFSLIICFNVSLLVEVLQLFLPQRNPSILDLAGNTLGGIIGGGVFALCQVYSPDLLSWKAIIKGWLSKRKLIYLALGYSSFVCCLIFSLQSQNNFSNWDTGFPLVVGNEVTGDRPWQGTVSQIYLAQHSLSPPEVAQVFGYDQGENQTIPWLTAYQLQGRGTYRDRQGLSPPLEWQQSSHHLSLTTNNWLSTKQPVTNLSKAIQGTSQFSILTTVATAATQQSGPARIISIAADPYRRNLTLGQQGSSLIVRLRTPLSGAGTTNINFTFPNLFTDTNPHQLLLNFARHRLQLIVDHPGKISTLSLSPAILFFHCLPAIGLRNFQITPWNIWILRSLFYGLIFCLPAALLVFLNCKLPAKTKN